MKISECTLRNDNYFDAGLCVDAAAESLKKHLINDGKVFVSLADTVSTAKLSKSLAKMIRQNKVHAISCSGANLETDIFDLVGQKHYLDNEILALWLAADKAHKSYYPHEYLYHLLDLPALKELFEINAQDSWLLAAKEKNLPIVTLGWEDSILGNLFVSHVTSTHLSSYRLIKTGLEQVAYFANWYTIVSKNHRIGYLQTGDDIIGNFPVCVASMLHQNPHEDLPCWSYFCQIKDSAKSSGVVQINWKNIDIKTACFLIESEASNVAPMIFSLCAN